MSSTTQVKISLKNKTLESLDDLVDRMGVARSAVISILISDAHERMGLTKAKNGPAQKPKPPVSPKRPANWAKMTLADQDAWVKANVPPEMIDPASLQTKIYTIPREMEERPYSPYTEVKSMPQRMLTVEEYEALSSDEDEDLTFDEIAKLLDD